MWLLHSAIRGDFTEQKRRGLDLKKVRVRAEQMSGERTLQAEEAARAPPEVERAWCKSEWQTIGVPGAE